MDLETDLFESFYFKPNVSDQKPVTKHSSSPFESSDDSSDESGISSLDSDDLKVVEQ